MVSKFGFLASLMVSACVSTTAMAQHSNGPTVLTVHPLGGGVYFVKGGVSNSEFIVGDKGVIVFDVQETPADARQELAIIATVTSKRVNEVILSHSDPDHVGGVTAFPADAEIISSENARSTIEASIAAPPIDPMNPEQQAQQRSEAIYQPEFKAIANRLPTRTISEPTFVVLDGVRMLLGYIAPAHTSGDLFAYLIDQKIVLCGDILINSFGPFPTIHVGGSSQGWIENATVLLALDSDTYVPGHGTVSTKSAFLSQLHLAEQRRDQVKALVEKNETFQQVKQALPEPSNGLPFPSFTQTTFYELVGGYPTALPPWLNFGLQQ